MESNKNKISVIFQIAAVGTVRFSKTQKSTTEISITKLTESITTDFIKIMKINLNCFRNFY